MMKADINNLNIFFSFSGLGNLRGIKLLKNNLRLKAKKIFNIEAQQNLGLLWKKSVCVSVEPIDSSF